jgi:hypothetical protein
VRRAMQQLQDKPTDLERYIQDTAPGSANPERPVPPMDTPPPTRDPVGVVRTKWKQSLRS